MMRYSIFLIFVLSFFTECSRQSADIKDLVDKDKQKLEENNEIANKIKVTDSIAKACNANYRIFYLPFYDRNLEMAFWVDSLSKVIRKKKLELFSIADDTKIDSVSNLSLADMKNPDKLILNNSEFFQIYKNKDKTIDLKQLMVIYANKMIMLMDIHMKHNLYLIEFDNTLLRLVAPDTMLMRISDQRGVDSIESWKTARTCDDYVYLACLQNDLLKIRYDVSLIFTENYGPSFLEAEKVRFDSLHRNKTTK